MSQEAAQALIYAGMAGSKLEGIQDKVNEYLDRVEALHNASKLREPSSLTCPDDWVGSRHMQIITEMWP